MTVSIDYRLDGLKPTAKNPGGADRAKEKTVRMLKGMTVVEAESILGI